MKSSCRDCGGAVEVVLGAVVDVVRGDVEGGGDGILVDIGLHNAAEVGGDELMRAAVFADERGLPGEEVGDAHLLPAGPLQLIAGALGVVAGGHVFPAVDVFAPVIHEPGFVEGVGGAELLLEVIDEAGVDVVIGGAVGGGLVVNLPADDVGVVFIVGDEIADEALAVVAVGGVLDVHVLAHAVKGLAAAEFAYEDLRVLMVEPGGDVVGGRAEDDFDAGFGHGIDDAIHPCVFKAAVFGLPEAPGGFAHAHDVEACGLHHGYVLIEAVVGLVLAVIGGAVEDLRDVGRDGGWRVRGLRGGGEEEAGQQDEGTEASRGEAS